MSLMDQQVRLLSDPNFRQKTEEDKQKELEAVVNPILAALGGGAGGGGMPGGARQ